MEHLAKRVCRSGDRDSESVFPAGIKELYAPEDPVVDICFVHGLSGDRERTWTAEGQTKSWPEILLPSELPDARILTFGYDAYFVSWGVASRNGLGDHAINLLRALARARKACQTRPLIFVAHSFGGIVCKKTLLLSHKHPEPRLENILEATVGVAFLGTPHLGASKASWAKVPVAMIGPFKSTNTKLLDVLRTNDVFLEDVREEFSLKILRHNAANGPIKVACFYEELPVLGVGFIVDKTSATLSGHPYLSIRANHMDMAKFANDAAPGIDELLDFLEQWTQTARPQTSHVPRSQAGDQDHRRVHADLRRPGPDPVHAAAASMSPNDMDRYAEQCQASLKFERMEERAGGIRLAAKGTCKWLLQHPKYLEWSTAGRGLFWIKGNPGSGKSTLLKHVYIHRQKTADGLLFSFFFHDRGSELQKTPLGFYRSLAYQLLCTLRTSVVDLTDVYKIHHALQPTAPMTIGDWVWTEEDLQQYILRTIPKILDTRVVWLLIDALDEAGEKNAVDVFRWLRSLVSATANSMLPFRLCVSCRPYPVVTPCNYAMEVCVEEENTKDISIFVQQQLQNELDKTDALTAEISDLITSRAKGIFLWVRLVVDDVIAALRRGNSPSAVREIVSNTPGEVAALYERQIQAMQGDRESLELLQWVCFSLKPLTPDELRWALAIPPDCQHTTFKDCDHAREVRDLNTMERHIRTASRGLVEAAWPPGRGAPVIQFIHQTTKEYVLGTGLAILHGGLPPAEIERKAHVHMAKICIQYLKKTSTDTYKDVWRPFLHYAVEMWNAHLGLADCHCQSDGNGDCAHVDDSRDLLRLLGWPANEIIRQVLRWSLKDNSGLTLLHILAEENCVSLLRVLFQQTPDIDVDLQDNSGTTPLMWASTNKKGEAAVRLLLGKGADIDCGRNDGETALLRAIRTESWDVAQLLLQNGADPNCADGSGETPLILSIPQTRMQLLFGPLVGNEAMVRLLLERGADPDVQHRRRGTPLTAATWEGNKGIVRLLLQHDADPNFTDMDGGTALSYAEEKGHKDIKEMLLKAGGVLSDQLTSSEDDSSDEDD